MNKIFLLPILLTTATLGYSQGTDTPVSFGIVTDVHYADIPARDNKGYDRSLEKLRTCVDTMNERNVDFLVELGDFKDMPTPSSEEKALVFLFRVEKVFSDFRGARYHVLGNHDVDCISKEQFFSIARNSGEEKGRSYFSFNCKGLHFIILDACFDSTGKEYSRGKFRWEDSNIPEAELKWLKKDLRKSRGKAIVFVHHVLDSDGPYAVNNAARVRSVLERSRKVAAVFQGHYHEGQYRMINGIHYYTLKAMVDGTGQEDNSFAIVTLSEDQVSIKGFGHAVSMNFGFRR